LCGREKGKKGKEAANLNTITVKKKGVEAGRERGRKEGRN